MIAAANGHIDAVLLLISIGANIHAVDAYHRTALHRGVSYFNVICYDKARYLHVLAACMA